MTGARIFIHPRCQEGPAAGALSAYLQGMGYDFRHTAVFYDAKRRRLELVRRVNENGAIQVLQRMDGTQFTHRLGVINDEPEAA